MPRRKTNLRDTCACCKVIECIDLFSHRKDEDELVGGELYLYSKLSHSGILDEELSTHVCSNGRLIECGCFFIETLNDLFPEDYLIIVSNEVVSDMKTSFYLAMSGHYRQAILLLRCVFEEFLYGLFFSTEHYKFAKKPEEKKEVKEKFKSWLNGGFRKSNLYLTEIVCRGRVISKEEKKEWNKLFDELSKYVHTIQKTPTGKAIMHKNVEIKTCLANVAFDKKSLIEWSEYYQDVFFLIFYKLITFYPSVKQEEVGQLALDLFKGEFRDKRKENDNSYLDKILKMKVRRKK